MIDIHAIDTLVRGFCVGLAASITVGPVAVLCIQRTLSKSRSAGLASGAGVACADTMMAVIALFFYSMLQSSIEQYAALLRVGGGIFVIIVGVYIFFQNPVPQIRRNRAGKSSMVQDFISMFWFTLANFVVVIPYLLAFFAMFSVGAGFEESDIPSVHRGLRIITGFFGGALTWWVALTSTISLFRRRFRPRHMLAINHIAGIVISLLGVYTVLSTFINVMPHGMH
ncbi:MAG: LysE family transporter [Alistipes sp.]|nr:LysE family transporter [Alistipes sp.]